MLSSEETNILYVLLQATRDIDFSVSDLEKRLNALLVFGWYYYHMKPHTEVISCALKLAPQTPLERYIAEGLYRPESVLYRLDHGLDKRQNSRKDYVQAHDIFVKLSDSVRASECSLELASSASIYAYRDILTVDAIPYEATSTNGCLRTRAETLRGGLCWCIGPQNETLEDLAGAKTAFQTAKINRLVDAVAMRCQ